MGQSDESAIGKGGYRDLILEWNAASADPRRANALFHRLHELYKEMRKTEAGRAAISDLIDDEHVAVRLASATHALPWDSERAERVLEEIERTDPSLHAVTAKWTLITHRRGELNLDW